MIRSLEKTAGLPKTQTCKYCKEQATDRAIWADGRAYVPVCPNHHVRVKKEMASKGDEVHKFSKIAEVQAHQQDTEWTCSAACLKAVLLHHGIDVSEEECVEAIGARPNRGAETTDIMNAAKSMGLHAEEGSFSGWHSVAKYLAEGLPIIADVQSFNYPGKGHYIVITGLHSDGVIAMDPNTKGKTVVDNWRIIPYDEMEWRWFDRAMEPPHNPMPKWGVVVFPPEEVGQEKTANGDMLAYYRDNPQKYKEYVERKKAKERRKKAKLKTANDPIKERRKVQGIPVSVEWRKGETRRYYNHDPLKKSSKGTIDYNKKMKAHYGYIPGTKDADGEQLDVYVGPNEKSDKIFVLEKKRATDGNFDEYKVMLGYGSKEEAKKSYLAHQGKDELGSVREMSRAQFDKFLSARKVKTAQVQGLLYELEKIGVAKHPMVEGARIGILLGAILGSVQGAADDNSSQLGKAVQYGAAGAPIGALAMQLAKSKR